MKCYIRFNPDLSKSEARVISESIEGVYLNESVALGATHGPVISRLLIEENPPKFYEVTEYTNGAIDAEPLLSPPSAKALVPRFGDSISVVVVEAKNEHEAMRIASTIMKAYGGDSCYEGEW